MSHIKVISTFEKFLINQIEYISYHDSLTAKYEAVSTLFFLVGKFGATAAFGTVYLYTGELFPTRVRSVCVGLCSMVGR